MTPRTAQVMRGQVQSFLVAFLMASVIWMPLTQAHEQKTLTVILLEDGVASGNISDPTFVQGNALWFRMEDSTNNTTMVVRLDQNLDGAFNASEDYESGVLVNECELDENGSLVDENCAVSATYNFSLSAPVGEYLFWIVRNHNGTEEVWNNSILLHKDVHEEEGPTPGDCFGLGCEDDGATNITTGDSQASDGDPIVLLAIIAFVGMIALSLSILKERREENQEDVLLEEA